MSQQGGGPPGDPNTGGAPAPPLPSANAAAANSGGGSPATTPAAALLQQAAQSGSPAPVVNNPSLTSAVVQVQQPPPLEPADAVRAAASQPIQGVETREREEPEQHQAVASRRRLIGYLLGGGTILAATGFFVWSISELDMIKAPNNPQHMAFAIAKLTAHAIITVAFMVFVYSVLRVSERMVIPHWWSRARAKMLLGEPDAASNLLRLTKQVTDMAEKLGIKVQLAARDDKKKAKK